METAVSRDSSGDAREDENPCPFCHARVKKRETLAYLSTVTNYRRHINKKKSTEKKQGAETHFTISQNQNRCVTRNTSKKKNLIAIVTAINSEKKIERSQEGDDPCLS